MCTKAVLAMSHNKKIQADIGKSGQRRLIWCYVPVMKLISYVVLSLILSGCVSHVSWHGGLPAREYKITFIDRNQTPIRGVTFKCMGEQGSITELIARELNTSAAATNDIGVLVLKHSSYEVHGSYKEFGPFRWDHQDVPLPVCQFFHGSKVVYSGPLIQINGKTLEV
jgi:hypothetical protein